MMRKRLTALVVFLLALVLIAPAAGQATSASALQNPGFEGWRSISDLAFGWTVKKGSGSLAADAEDVTEGSLALRFTSAASQTSEMKAVQMTAGLSAGTLYELTADFKLPEALPSGSGFRLSLADSGGGEILSSGDPVSHTDGEWMQFSCLFIAPSNGKATIALSFLPDGGGQRRLLLDNIQLWEAEKGKMNLYKSPLGYVLPGVVTSEAAAGQQLSGYYSGAVALSGGRAAEAGETVIARLVRPVGETPLALVGSFGTDEKELLDLETFSGSGGYAAASLLQGKTVKGFLWEKGGLTPAGNSGQLTFPKEEKPIVRSGDFESYIGGTPQGWSAYSGWRGGFCFYETEEETGNHRMRVTDTAGGSAPYVYRRIPVAPDTKYRFSVGCVQQDMADKGAGVKFEFYTKDKEYISEQTERFLQSTENPSFTFQTPPGAAEVAVLLRIYTAGTAYFDNVAMECISTPPAGSVTTDEFFYYPEWESGTATVIANTVSFPEAENGSYDIALCDGGAVLEAAAGRRLTNGEGKWQFSVSKMLTAGKVYTVEATVYDEDGKKIGTCNNTVYQYPRPAALDANGDYYIDSKLFVPHIMYHVTDYGVNGTTPESAENALMQYGLLRDAGYNVVQLSTGCIYEPDICLKTLDKLHEYGLLAMVPLYDKAVPPARPERAERIKTLLRAIKDHPAVFAYGIYDEPSIGVNGLTEQDLIDSYRLVRDIDKVHPALMVIAPGSHSTNFTETQRASMIRQRVTKYTDVLCYDPYVACWNDVVSTFPYEVHKAAEEFVPHNRPCYNLNQVFDWRGFFPTMDEYRHMWYQACMGGTKGAGAYSFSDALGDSDEDDFTSARGLWESDIWDGILQFKKSGEMDMADKYFHSGKYPIFDEERTEEYLYRSYVDGNELYAVVLRLDETRATNREEQPTVSVSIPLVSKNGKVKIGGFRASLLYGAAAETVIGSGTLQVSLPWRKALVYKITPDTPVDYTALS